MIERVWLKNFRRYKEAKISLHPGVNFVSGPNNAGKSTLLYAIEYALFGRVGGLASQGALMHPKERSVGVELLFRGKDGARYRLQRMHVRPPRAKTKVQGHFTLKRQDEEGGAEHYVLSSDFQDREEALALALQNALGLSRRLFEVAVHLRQGQIALILEGAPELDVVLGVTAAVVAADETRAMAREQEKELGARPMLEAERERLQIAYGEETAALERVQLRIEEHRSRLEELDALLGRGEHDAVLSAACDAARGSQQELEEHVDAHAVKEEIDRMSAASMPRSLEVLDGEIETLLAKIEALGARIRELEEDRRDGDRLAGDLDARVARREAALSLAAAGAHCESCGQPIDEARARAELEQWVETLAGCASKQSELDHAIDETRSQLQQTHASLGEVQGERVERAELLRSAAEASTRLAAVEESAKAAIRELLERARAVGHPELARAVDAIENVAPEDPTGRLAALEAALDVIGSLRDERLQAQARAEAEREGLRLRIEEDEEVVAGIDSRLAELARQRARMEAELGRLEGSARLGDQLGQLSAAFKTLQVTLRDHAASSLERRIFELHRVLSGADDELQAVRIDSKNYALYVTPTDLGHDVPAHLYQGGGHQLLLGLAFKIAIAELLGATAFLLLDEPTYGLDEVRRSKLLGRLQSLSSIGQLIVITHHRVDVSGRVLEVERKGKRSEVIAQVEASA